MTIPPLIAKLPEVKSALVSTRQGGVVEVMREREGERVAAVVGFLSSTLGEAGDELGLGHLRRVAFNGPGRGGVIAVAGAELVAAFVEPPSSVASIEKLLAGAVGQKEA
ncbi:MAG TPA: hypothetical protein VMT17_02520 [Anaeromyxobacteraceae bacterium]|nr:hypothetical protein [Anaeromyxobacteraceae bacterium]